MTVTLTKPGTPKWVTDYRDASRGDITITVVVYIVGSAFAGLIIDMLADLFGLGGFGWESDPTPRTDHIELMIFFICIAFGVGASVWTLGRRIACNHVHPPLTFHTAAQREAYTQYHSLNESDKQDVQYAYRAFKNILPSDPQFTEACEIWRETYEIVHERTRQAALNYRDPVVDEARAHLVHLQGLKELDD